MDTEKIMREQVLALLNGGNAHMNFSQALTGFPIEYINRKAVNFSYTFWHLLEHMRIVQWDILEFIRNPAHVSPDYPSGYWPPEEEEAQEPQWQQTIAQFRADLEAVQNLVADPSTDFFAPIPYARDYTVFREILLVADHNAYHLGEIVTLRQAMAISPADKW